jgi:hypothetical protein
MYKKLTDLVDKQFKFIRVTDSAYTRWDDVNKKYERSDTPQKGFQRKWKIEISDKDGVSSIDVSDDFLSKVLLDGYAKNCKIENQIVYLKTNGKTGMEIRYYPSILTVKEDTYEQPEQEFNF